MSLVRSRAVEPDPRTEAILDGWSRSQYFWVEPKPEIWVPDPQRQFVGQASYANKTVECFSYILDQIVPEPEPKASRCWSRSQKI